MALVRKILETTIPSGGTVATFNDSDIPNSLIRVYSTNSNIYPQNISLSGNLLTVTYEPVTSALGVAVELVKQGLEIDDNLTSENTDHALSAKQGKVLKGLIDDMTIPENISDLQDVDITDIEEGQVLAWNSITEKFENVAQSGGGEVVYSTEERLIGKWIDGDDLYEKTVVISNPTKGVGKTSAHGISNINKICYYEFFYSDSLSSIRSYAGDDTNYQWWCNVNEVNRTTISHTLGTSWPGTGMSLYITIRYTKTV